MRRSEHLVIVDGAGSEAVRTVSSLALPENSVAPM
jgi:hypothetical protein